MMAQVKLKGKTIITIWITIFILFTNSIKSHAQEIKLLSPSGVTVDPSGIVFVADRRGQTIIKVDQKTNPKVVVGTGENGFNGDLRGTETKISNPESIISDKFGNIIFTDRSNSRVRRLNMMEGTIETLAGTGVAGYSGDGGDATKAQISYPFGIACDANNNIFIADTENHVIRKVDANTGIITTIAGNGKSGFSGDGTSAINASFTRPHIVTVDESGNVIVGDSGNQRIRHIDLKTGIITTLFGSGELGFSEDGTNAKVAKFGFFGGIVIQSDKLIFSEWINKRIRIIDRRTGNLESLKDNNGNVIEIDGPYGMALDKQANVYVSEANKGRLLKVTTRGEKIVLIGNK